MQRKIIQFFQNFLNDLQKIDRWIVFCTVGLFLPMTILISRWFTIFLKVPFLFKEYSFHSINNTFWEPFFFCYLPALLFCFFLYKRKPCFHQKIFKKCDPLFCLYSKMIKLELFVCEKKYIAILLLFFYFYLYLLVSFHGYFLEPFFLSFRQFVFSYFTFKTFFEREQIEVDRLYFFHFLSFYRVFIKNYVSLQSKENIIYLDLVYGLNSLLFLSFFRENRIIQANIKEYEQNCEILLSFLRGTQKEEQYYDLLLEKKKLFTFKQKKPFFFFSLSSILLVFQKSAKI